MQKNIIIIGNSGAALECYACILEILAISSFHSLFTFKGFLSHKGYKGNLGEFSSYALGSDEDYILQKDDIFVLGIGDNTIRNTAYANMKARNGEFLNLISPLVYIGQNVVLGEGNVLLKCCNISNNTIIGNANYLNGSVVIGHDVNIGDANFFATHSAMYGSAKLGSYNRLAPKAMLLEKSKLGNNNTIAPAAVVYKGCKDNALMAGNPAVKIANTNKEILV